MSDPKDPFAPYSHPTPTSGMPAVFATVDHGGPMSAATGSAILDALRALNETTLVRFDKLDRKVDALGDADEALKLAQLRLEQRFAATDEQAHIDRGEVARLRTELISEIRRVESDFREEIRAERVARNTDNDATSKTFVAMQDFVEKATKVSTEASAKVLSALKERDTYAGDIEQMKVENATQNQRLAAIERGIGTLISLATSKRVMAYVAIGGIVGGAIMAIAEKVMH